MGNFEFPSLSRDIAEKPAIFCLFLMLKKGPFLDASKHLYKRVCPSVGPSVRPSVGPSQSAIFAGNEEI